MSQRSFVFCATCNPHGYRCVDHGIQCVEQRGLTSLANHESGRTSDSRSWYEGNIAEALADGWRVNAEGQLVCLSCLEQQPMSNDDIPLTLDKDLDAVQEILFCDLCNPLAIRNPEQRRKTKREGSSGRRVTDGRAWHEGDIWSAILAGWCVTHDNKHYCPRCGNRHPELFEQAG